VTDSSLAELRADVRALPKSITVQLLAAESGVSDETIYKLLRGERIGRTSQRLLADAVKKLTVHPAGDRTSQVDPPAAAALAVPAWSAEARAFVLEFQAEAARDGASDEELDYIRRALTDPGAYVFYEGGRPRVLTEDEVMIELRALGEGLRVWLEKRKERRRRS
jgi:hypothetical protein